MNSREYQTFSRDERRGVEKGAKNERAKNCWMSYPNMEKTRDSTQSSLSKYQRSSVFVESCISLLEDRTRKKEKGRTRSHSMPV